MPATQPMFDVQCEWGLNGIRKLAPISDVIIIVDVLSFSTSVDIAVGRGAAVFPYGGLLADAPDYAQAHGALLASTDRRTTTQPSLSPQSLQNLPAGTRLVLPSLNGSACSFAARLSSGKQTSVFTACLRNAPAVARAANHLAGRIAVIPAGEHWKHDHTLRPALEDWIGAGAVIAHLSGTPSPEAASAVQAFEHTQSNLLDTLIHIESGQELIEGGFMADVEIAAQHATSSAAPILIDDAFQSHSPQ